jgi:hypothetical protein
MKKTHNFFFYKRPDPRNVKEDERVSDCCLTPN